MNNKLSVAACPFVYASANAVSFVFANCISTRGRFAIYRTCLFVCSNWFSSSFKDSLKLCLSISGASYS